MSYLYFRTFFAFVFDNKNIFFYVFVSEPRKDKTDAPIGGNGTLSPNTEQPSCQGLMLPPPGGGAGCGSSGGNQNHESRSGGGCGSSRDQMDSHSQNSKMDRPNTLGTSKLARRVNICYHNDHCKYQPKHVFCSKNRQLLLIILTFITYCDKNLYNVFLLT